MSPLENYYQHLPPAYAELLLATRDILLELDLQLKPEWKWRLPFFYRHGRGICYLNYRKSRRDAYLAFAAGRHIDNPLLVNEGQKTTRMLMLSPLEDIPAEAIADCTRQATHWVEVNQKSWG